MGPSQRLNAYLRSVMGLPFKWGEHDCLTFSNAAFAVYHGYGYADDWLGRYIKNGKPISKAKMQTEFGAETFDEAIGIKLQEIGYVPPRGALLATKKIERFATGYALGISVGTKAAFLSDKGVVYSPLDQIDKAWMPK